MTGAQNISSSHTQNFIGLAKSFLNARVMESTGEQSPHAHKCLWCLYRILVTWPTSNSISLSQRPRKRKRNCKLSLTRPTGFLSRKERQNGQQQIDWPSELEVDPAVSSSLVCSLELGVSLFFFQSGSPPVSHSDPRLQFVSFFVVNCHHGNSPSKPYGSLVCSNPGSFQQVSQRKFKVFRSQEVTGAQN